MTDTFKNLPDMSGGGAGAELTANKGQPNGYAALDANTLIPVNQIPPAALERLVVVADQPARYALTLSIVQNGDTVLQTDTNTMYFVKDSANLGNSVGYAIYNAGTAAAVAWGGISGIPTPVSTLLGSNTGDQTTAITQTQGDNSTKFATTAYVDTGLGTKQASGSYEVTTNKDATGGYTGLTLFKINFKNVLNTFTSFFTNANTASRTYTFQNRDGTIADDTDLALKAPLTSPALISPSVQADVANRVLTLKAYGAPSTYSQWDYSQTSSTLSLKNDAASTHTMAHSTAGQTSFGNVPNSDATVNIFGLTTKKALTLINHATTPGDLLTCYASNGTTVLSKIDSAGGVTGIIKPTTYALTDAATIAVDCSLGNQGNITLTTSRNIGAPTGSPSDGQTFLFRITQGGSGSNVITTWDTIYKWNNTITLPTLSTAVGKIDYIGFKYSVASTAWHAMGVILGN